MNHKTFAEMIDTTDLRVKVVDDGRLTNDAISFLCRIQHFNDQIDRPNTNEKRLLAIGVACEILVEIIDFAQSTGQAETRENKEFLSNFVERKNQVEALLKKQSWSEMVGMDQERSRQKVEEYTQLGLRFEDIFRKRLTSLNYLVRDPAQAREWQDGWSSLITEFSTRW